MGGNEQIALRLPPEVAGPLRAEAAEKGTTIQAVILKALARRYKVKVPKPKRGRPKKGERE